MNMRGSKQQACHPDAAAQSTAADKQVLPRPLPGAAALRCNASVGGTLPPFSQEFRTCKQIN